MAINQQDRTELHRLARETVAHAVAGGPPAAIIRRDGVLGEKRGCFVTLTNGGRLRGCIGTFSPSLPLAESIVEMARNACRDPRFTTDPIRPSELDALDIKLSVLSPLEKTDDPMGIELGVHGIYIIAAGRAGCFLPEVATEQGWNTEQFLSYCCAHKAGLPADAWKDPQTTVLTFTSECF